MDLDKISKHLTDNSIQENAYFGITEWVDQEFCINANDDGLKLFAAKLLEIAALKEERKTYGLNQAELKWYFDELDIKFIQWTEKSRKEILDEIQPFRGTILGKLIPIVLVVILIYLLAAGVIFTKELF